MAARPSPIICHTMGLDLHSNKAVSPDIRFKKSSMHSVVLWISFRNHSLIFRA